MPAQERRSASWLGAGSLLLLLIVLLAIIPSGAKFHSDEQFYTDAAIRMIQTGDYWTPTYPDGRVRLLKPIITYWASAASMQVFGISLFAVRLPFALAGVLLVYLTYKLARNLVPDHRTAFLAGVILASNVQVLTLASRATPDALVCVFVLLSMWGFARVWLADDPSRIGPWLVWCGMGLAVQTKGLLGLCPLGGALVYWAVIRPEPARTRALLNWPAMLTGLALALFWYVVMLKQHGPGSFKDFFSDQVGAKVTSGPVMILGNLTAYILAGLRHFLPWTALVLSVLLLDRKNTVAFWKAHRRECVFLLALFLVLVIAFGFGSDRRTRYLVAAYPMLAVLMAMTLGRAAGGMRGLRWLKPTLRVAGVVLAVLGLGLAAGGVSLDWRVAAGGATVLVAGVLGIVVSRQAKEIEVWLWVGAVAVIAFGLVGACFRPVFSRSAVPDLAAALIKTGRADGAVYSFLTPGPLDAQLRLYSAGALQIKPVNPEKPRFAKAEVIVAAAEAEARLREEGYQLVPVSITHSAPTDSWLGRLVSKPKTGRNKQPPGYWVGTKTGMPP